MKRVRTSLVGIPGSPYLSTIYFGDGETAQAAADKAAELWVIFEQAMSSNAAWSVDPVVATLDAATGELTGTEEVAGSNGQGDIAGEWLPPATQVLVQWRTGTFVNGRELRGRTFIPGVFQNANDNGVLSSTVRTALSTAIAGWLTAGPVPLIWSRAHLVSSLVSSASVWNQFAVLRSRRD